MTNTDIAGDLLFLSANQTQAADNMRLLLDGLEREGSTITQGRSRRSFSRNGCGCTWGRSISLRTAWRRTAKRWPDWGSMAKGRGRVPPAL